MSSSRELYPVGGPLHTSRREFSVAISRALGMIVVTVHGALSAGSSGQLRHILWDLIDQQGNRNVVLDLRDMTLGDGADLELFVDASHHAQELGGRLTLSGLCDVTSASEQGRAG